MVVARKAACVVWFDLFIRWWGNKCFSGWGWFRLGLGFFFPE